MRSLIIYGSTTGNTENMANEVLKTLKEKGLDVIIRNVRDIRTAELVEYDLVILGSSTWGDGELQDDFIQFHGEMSKVDLSGKMGAVFGCGMSYYQKFCAAVEILNDALRDQGAKLVIKPLKIDGEIDQHKNEIRAWAEKVAENIIR